MSKIQNLLRESTTSASNSQGRPELLALTRAVNALIYTDMVAIQPTSQPTATLFGIRYISPTDKITAFT
ncbi:capsid vertex protein, partial [Klebsiella pneumoniae]|nr:capsid vertex protein [Klebsiella pneumoniae]